MNLAHIPLKLIRAFNLVDTNDYNQLSVDVKEWETTCVADSEDKIKRLYHKIHFESIWLRLVNPFLYFWLTGWVRDLQSPAEPDFLEEN